MENFSIRTNQNLLIVAGSLIVVILVVAVLLAVRSGFDENIKDLALERINELGTLANEYYNRPLELNDGTSSYTGFKIPEEFVRKYSDFTYQIIDQQNLLLLQLDSTTDTYQGKPYRFLAHYVPDGLKILYLFNPGESKWRKLYDRRWPDPEKSNQGSE
jgi:hypothetical protein